MKKVHPQSIFRARINLANTYDRKWCKSWSKDDVKRIRAEAQATIALARQQGVIP